VVIEQALGSIVIISAIDASLWQAPGKQQKPAGSRELAQLVAALNEAVARLQL
jgi:hypothetical protein